MLRRGFLHLMAFLLAFAPFMGSFANEADAATSRVAIIQSLSGTVEVQKSGGNKKFQAFAKMSLNEGDILSTGANSSAVLQFGNGNSADDKMTVSANTKLTFSKLSDRGGTRTKVSMFNGSAWVDVKSISSKNDEFTLETPTAIMGVRGTHLFAIVDPLTGATRLAVAAGVVNAQLPNGNSIDVKPGDNALILNNEEDSGEIIIAPADLDALMAQSTPDIVQAIIEASALIAQENLEKLDDYFAQEDLADSELGRLKSNVENLLGAIVDAAVRTGKITQDRVNELIEEARQQSGVEIDLSKKERTLTEEELRRQEALKQREAEAVAAAQAKREEKEAALKELEAERAAIEARRQQAEAEKQRLLEEKRQRAKEAYESQLSELEKQRFEEAQQQLEQQNGAIPSTSPAGGGGGGGGGGSSPSPSSSSGTKYQVIYDANGGEGAPIDNNWYAPGDVVTVLDKGQLSKPGYSFQGWQKSGTDTIYIPGMQFEMGSDNVTLYAVWQPEQGGYGSPLDWLNVYYYTEPPLASAPAEKQQLEGINLDAPSDSKTLPYLYLLPDNYPGDYNLIVELSPKNPEAAVVVKANGVPVPEYVDYENNGISTGTTESVLKYHIPLSQQNNTLNFEVYDSSDAAPQNYKLTLDKPLLPEGLNISSSDVTFQSVGPNLFAAETTQQASLNNPFVFDVTIEYDETLYGPPTLINYGSAMIGELKEDNGNSVTHSFEVTLNGIHTFEVNVPSNGRNYRFAYKIAVGVTPPNWVSSEPVFEYHEASGDYQYIGWNGTILEAEVKEESGFLFPVWSNSSEELIEAIYNLDTRKVTRGIPLEGWFYPITITSPITNYEIYVRDETRLHTFTYPLRFIYNSNSEVVRSIEIEYESGGVQTVSAYKADMDEDVYVARVPNTSSPIFLNLEIDWNAYSSVELVRYEWDSGSSSWAPFVIDTVELDEEGFVSIRLGGENDPNFRRYNEYEICPLPNDSTGCYPLVVIADDIEREPVQIISGGTDDDVLFAGPDHSVVYYSTETGQAMLRLDNGNRYQVRNEYLDWFYFEDYGYNLQLHQGVNVIYIYDPSRQDFLHTLTIYNGYGTLPVSFQMEDLGILGASVLPQDDGLLVTVTGNPSTITMQPQFPAGSNPNAFISDIYVMRYSEGPEKVNGIGGVYEIELNPEDDTIVWIVIEDGIYVKPVKVTIQNLN